MTLKDEMYGKKKVFPNIELYLSCIYMMIGFPARLVSNLTLTARICGICAHIMEQKYVHKKKFLKNQIYVGKVGLKVRPKF
jgi:citrate synthase